MGRFIRNLQFEQEIAHMPWINAACYKFKMFNILAYPGFWESFEAGEHNLKPFWDIWWSPKWEIRNLSWQLHYRLCIGAGQNYLERKMNPTLFVQKTLQNVQQFCWALANKDNCCDLQSLNCFSLGKRKFCWLSLCSCLRGKYFLGCWNVFCSLR